MAKKISAQPITKDESDETESQEVFLSDLTPGNEPTKPRRGRPGGVKGQKNLQWTELRTRELLQNYQLFGMNFEDIAEALQGNPAFEGYTDSLTPDKVRAALKKAFAAIAAEGVEVPEIPRKVTPRKAIAPALALFFQSLQASQ